MNLETVENRLMEGYYEPYKPDTGALPLNDASAAIAARLGMVNGLSTPAAAEVRHEILNSITPEDFKQSAVEICTEVLNHGGYVFPLTVGDPELQRAKFENGRFVERMKEGLFDQSILDSHYDEYICPESKLDKFPEILFRCAKNGVTDVYMPDDNEKTIRTVYNVSQHIAAWNNNPRYDPQITQDMPPESLYAAKLFSEFKRMMNERREATQTPIPIINPLTVHNFHIKPDEFNDRAGSFDAFAAKMQEAISENDQKHLGKLFALVPDVDETMMHTKRHLYRAARKIHDKYLL